MNAKNNIKKIIICFQVFAVIFLILGILGKHLLENGFEILFFENTCLYFLYQVCFSVFLTTEFIMLIVLAVKSKKPLLFIANVVLLPLLLLQLFATEFAIFDSEATTKSYTYEQFEKDIVIENRSFLLSGVSVIYENTNGYILRKIASVGGDDGYCPLKDESLFSVKVDDKSITYFYYFDDYTENEDSIEVLTIEHENGHFVED